MAKARTAAQRAALRKAQLASARKRRGKKNPKLAAAHRRARRNVKITLATGGLALAAMGVAGAYYSKKTASGGPPSRSTGSRSRRTGAAFSVNSRGVAKAYSKRDVARRTKLNRLLSRGGPASSGVIGFKDNGRPFTAASLRRRKKPTVKKLPFKGSAPVPVRLPSNSKNKKSIYLLSTKQIMKNYNNPNYVWDL